MIFTGLLEVQLEEGRCQKEDVDVFLALPLNLEIRLDTQVRGRGKKEWSDCPDRANASSPRHSVIEVECGLPGWLIVLLAFPHNRFIAAGHPEPAYLSP